MKSTQHITLEDLKHDAIGYDLGFWFYDITQADGKTFRLAIMKKNSNTNRPTYQIANGSTQEIIATSSTLEEVPSLYNKYVDSLQKQASLV